MIVMKTNSQQYWVWLADVPSCEWICLWCSESGSCDENGPCSRICLWCFTRGSCDESGSCSRICLWCFESECSRHTMLANINSNIIDACMCDMRYAWNCMTNTSTFIIKRKHNSGRRTERQRDFLFWKSLASIEKSFWSSCSPLKTFHCFSSKMEWQKRYCSCLKSWVRSKSSSSRRKRKQFSILSQKMK